MGRPKGFDRRQVLEKTLPVFWKKGFADTSVQDLERSTGVNKSGLYSEFSGKEDLYIESLKHFIVKTDALGILQQEPLGWENIQQLLLLGTECRGTKGCFVANSVREFSILPGEAKTVITEHIKKVRAQMGKNLHGKTKADPLLVADIILTFNSGLSLEQNLMSSGNVKARVLAFLESVRKL